MRFRVPSPRVLKVIDTAIGTLLCASAALLLALAFNQTHLEFVLPLICMAVVVAVAARYGAATGVLGSVVSALLLAYFVYAPEHSFEIANAEARANLSWLLLGGISLSFLFAPVRNHLSSKREEREDQSSEHKQA